MFARFDDNPAMTLRVIKETKRYGRTDGRTDGRTRENSIPPTNKVCGGYNKDHYTKLQKLFWHTVKCNSVNPLQPPNDQVSNVGY